MFKRTHTCGELTKNQIGESVSLNGWVNTVRLHGQVIFIDLRDRYGKTQIVFNSEDFDGDLDEEINSLARGYEDYIKHSREE